MDPGAPGLMKACRCSRPAEGRSRCSWPGLIEDELQVGSTVNGPCDPGDSRRASLKLADHRDPGDELGVIPAVRAGPH